MSLINDLELYIEIGRIGFVVQKNYIMYKSMRL